MWKCLSYPYSNLPVVAIRKVTWENIEFFISQQPKRDAQQCCLLQTHDIAADSFFTMNMRNLYVCMYMGCRHNAELYPCRGQSLPKRLALWEWFYDGNTQVTT